MAATAFSVFGVPCWSVKLASARTESTCAKAQTFIEHLLIMSWCFAFQQLVMSTSNHESI